MAQKRIIRTDQEWFDLIKECRTSELKVKVWCEQHGITPKALYYHTRQLRQKGYSIPQKAAADIQLEKQEVVCLGIPGSPLQSDYTMNEGRTAIRVGFRGIQMEVTNHAEQEVITNLFHALLGLC